MSLVIHYWIGDVQDSQVVSASEMTYIVSGGALIYSLTAVTGIVNVVTLRWWIGREP